MGEKNKLSIISMSGDFDKVIAVFTLASGAAAVGYEVNIDKAKCICDNAKPKNLWWCPLELSGCLGLRSPSTGRDRCKG